jgi:pyrroline-5-carboxylate reductase
MSDIGKVKIHSICILGAGNIGMAIANGLVQSGEFKAQDITLTRRRTQHLQEAGKRGFFVTESNSEGVKRGSVLILAVEPQQLNNLLDEISKDLSPGKHILISVITGAPISQIRKRIPKGVSIIRAMPNTAIANREAMTCIASEDSGDQAIHVAESIFRTVGKTLVVNEEQMTAATALGACGIAFFLRAIRAASQGGIEIGFHSADALLIAAQTAKGAASLLLSRQNHPEFEIDRVTTPRGCTISGLNQMEHEGFSSAMIKGILTSAEIASKLYSSPGNGKD